MAVGTTFRHANGVLKPAPGDEGMVYPLPVWTDGHRVISCWQLTADEIAEIVMTGKLYFEAIGPTHPPVRIHGNSPFRS